MEIPFLPKCRAGKCHLQTFSLLNQNHLNFHHFFTFLVQNFMSSAKDCHIAQSVNDSVAFSDFPSSQETEPQVHKIRPHQTKPSGRENIWIFFDKVKLFKTSWLYCFLTSQIESAELGLKWISSIFLTNWFLFPSNLQPFPLFRWKNLPNFSIFLQSDSSSQLLQAVLSSFPMKKSNSLRLKRDFFPLEKLQVHSNCQNYSFEKLRNIILQHWKHWEVYNLIMW